jgi:hypothetical protein
MSQQETIIGKLRLLDKINGETLEDQCKRVYHKQYRELSADEIYGTYKEMLSDEGYDKVVIYEDNLYEVISRKDMDGMDIFEISKAEDGTYDFTLSYYNGGCCFSEAIEYAFNRMKKDGDSQ